MKKIPLVNPNNYFKESEKVIQIVRDREDDVRRSLPVEYKLRIAKETLDEVTTREEYEELKNLIKDLEFEMKYGKDFVPAIPEEYHNRIAFNRVHEEEQIDSEIAKQKELLLELVDGIKDPLINVLRNIEELEERKLIGKKIDVLLDEKILLDGTIRSVFYHANYLGFSAGHSVAKESRKKGEEFLDAIRGIATAPKQQSGIKKPSIFSRVLGGDK